MAHACVTKLAQAPVVKRGDGVETTLLIGKELCATARVTTGITRFPAGKKVPFHSHNCDEQVCILEGEALVEVEGQEPMTVVRNDMTYVPKGRSHRFVNTGKGPLVILWIYDTDHVTRTFTESGETVEHLSQADLVSLDAR